MVVVNSGVIPQRVLLASLMNLGWDIQVGIRTIDHRLHRRPVSMPRRRPSSTRPGTARLRELPMFDKRFRRFNKEAAVSIGTTSHCLLVRMDTIIKQRCLPIRILIVNSSKAMLSFLPTRPRTIMLDITSIHLMVNILVMVILVCRRRSSTTTVLRFHPA